MKINNIKEELKTKKNTDITRYLFDLIKKNEEDLGIKMKEFTKKDLFTLTFNRTRTLFLGSILASEVSIKLLTHRFMPASNAFLIALALIMTIVIKTRSKIGIPI